VCTCVNVAQKEGKRVRKGERETNRRSEREEVCLYVCEFGSGFFCACVCVFESGFVWAAKSFQVLTS
jgi:hypothetical protein